MSGRCQGGDGFDVSLRHVGFDSVEHTTSELLGYSLAYAAAFDYRVTSCGSDQHVPAVVRDPFRAFGERTGVPWVVELVSSGNVGNQWRAVDQDSHDLDFVLVDLSLVPVEMVFVRREQLQIILCRYFGYYRLAAGQSLASFAFAASPVKPQC